MISNKEKETVWTLKEVEHLSNSEIGRRVGISRTKVIEILKHKKYRNEHLMDTISEIQEEKNESLLDALRNDQRPKQIMNKILDILNDDEQLERELKKQQGFRNVVGAMKVIIDTGVTARRDKRESDKAQQEKILNTTETMNDNFEKAIIESLQGFTKKDVTSLIEEDSLDVSIVQ